jgi:alpha-N-arabinofuranosidase
MFFNSFFRHADVVKMANLAQMVNVIAPIMANKTGVFLQPTYFPLAEYSKQRRNTALEVWWDAPRYRIPNRPGDVRYLDISASYNPATRQVFLNVLNRSKDKDITAAIESQSGAVAGDLQVWEMNHPDLKATHTFGDDQKVRPVRKVFPAELSGPGANPDNAAGKSFRYTFPAHSLTILTFPINAR